MDDRGTYLRSAEELLHDDLYTAEELADLLGMDIYLVREAIFNHRLKADLVDHHIICIRREDALQWLADREAGRT
jgi:hypothetical protein